MNKILVIDDDQDIGLLLKKFFSKNGFEVFTSITGKNALKCIREEKDFDIVICDFKLPDYSGLDLIPKIKILEPLAQIIMVTGYSDLRVAVEALKKGAFDYVTKPLYPDEILLTVQQALEKKNKHEEKPRKRKESKSEYIHGVSNQSQLVSKHIQVIAPTDLSVIIYGETGTGKEYVAREIHRNSKRSKHPFIALDCGALPKDLAGSELFGHIKGAFTGAISDKKGCFEAADKGTLFLDEIGNLSYDNQVKLLRVLQERVVKPIGSTKTIPVDVRLLVATNEDLKTSVDDGSFREDIYHRLNEFKIDLSPLRERPGDIELFAKHFLQEASVQLDKNIESIPVNVLKKLVKYQWLGNLRELKNVIKRAVLLSSGSKIQPKAIPSEIMHPELSKASGELTSGHTQLTLQQVSDLAEKKVIIETLRKTDYNKTRTAELLDIDRKTLYNKMSSFGIDPAP
jgi:two-component system response regulator HydG